MSGLTIRILGKEAVLARFDVAIRELTTTKAAAGLTRGGIAIQTRAKANLKPHHYHGRAEQQTTVSAPLITPTSVSVTVGIHGGVAPEGRPLEYGWKSGAGKRPPSSAIEDWLTGSSQGAAILASATGVAVKRNSRGFIASGKSSRVAADDRSKVKGLAFVIARNIGKRGFAFGELHWLESAVHDETPSVLGEMQKAMAL